MQGFEESGNSTMQLKFLKDSGCWVKNSPWGMFKGGTNLEAFASLAEMTVASTGTVIVNELRRDQILGILKIETNF